MSMNILITGGGCREPIDGVRCITNTSTGRTAAELAVRFAASGFHVTCVFAAQSALPSAAETGTGSVRLVRFGTGAELSDILKKELTSCPYDAVVHAAAVSDFLPSVITVNGTPFPAGTFPGKIPSGAHLTVTFGPAPKIAPELRKWAEQGNPGLKTVIVCFKLTDGADKETRLHAASLLFEKGASDYVVLNDVTEIRDGKHPFVLLGAPAHKGAAPSVTGSGRTVEALADRLFSVLCRTDAG
jgi:Phosphopantothenoylcysteine synthetase/decarboxylase